MWRPCRMENPPLKPFPSLNDTGYHIVPLCVPIKGFKVNLELPLPLGCSPSQTLLLIHSFTWIQRDHTLKVMIHEEHLIYPSQGISNGTKFLCVYLSTWFLVSHFVTLLFYSSIFFCFSLLLPSLFFSLTLYCTCRRIQVKGWDDSMLSNRRCKNNIWIE